MGTKKENNQGELLSAHYNDETVDFIVNSYSLLHYSLSTFYSEISFLPQLFFNDCKRIRLQYRLLALRIHQLLLAPFAN
uniref:Uncharacterized protein n=1 Tax=Romanomermis culicivorax TaxID=13658 RepID=A0A915HMF0_ROMCU